MQPFAVTEAGLDGVAEGVAEIQHGAHAFLALIVGDYDGFVAAGDFDRMRQRGGIARHEAIHIGFQPGEELGVADQSVFDDFGNASRELAVGQGFQGVGVGDDHPGLVKRADHVFAEWMIDRSFAADRRINLSQQGGRDLDERRAALKHRCGKAGEITDDAATQCNQRGLALRAVRQQGIKHFVQCAPVFVCFAVGQHDGLHRNLLLRQTGLQCLKV